MLGKLRKMLLMKRLGLILIILTVAGTGTLPLDAKNKKGDKLVAEGRAKEARKDFDAALELYEQALSQDPADPYYQLCADRARFQAGQAHVTLGLKIRAQGNLTQALIEFQKALQIDGAMAVRTGLDAGVATRDGMVVDADIAIGAAADHQRFVG